MSNCACVAGPDCYGSDGFRCDITRTARKSHTCHECHGWIAERQQYEVSTGLFGGDIFRFKTCSVCVEIRNAFFCEGFQYGGIRHDLREHIREMDGVISEACTANLSDEAFDVVVGMVEDVRREIKALEAAK